MEYQILILANKNTTQSNSRQNLEINYESCRLRTARVCSAQRPIIAATSFHRKYLLHTVVNLAKQ